MSGALPAASLVLATLAQAAPRFEVAVEAVKLDVFVAHEGQPVLGLKQENFVVEDNGVRQQVRLLDIAQVDVAAVLVFDTSGSLAGRALGHLQAGARALLRDLRHGDRAALVTFDDAPSLRVELTPDIGRVAEAIGRIQPGGRTALHDGLYCGLVLPTGAARRLVVLFTDGDDNASWLGADQLLLDAARSEALVQIVAVVPDDATARSGPGLFLGRPAPSPDALAARSRWLRSVAEVTGGRYWEAEATERLEATFVQILREMSTRYLLAFEPTGVERQGEHQLRIRLAGATGRVRARTRYVVPPSR